MLDTMPITMIACLGTIIAIIWCCPLLHLFLEKAHFNSVKKNGKAHGFLLQVGD